MTTIAPPAIAGRPVPTATTTPLPAVLAFTAVNALSAGLVTSGLFFAARAGYGFGPTANYALGALVGAAYTVGALRTSRVVTRSRGRARLVLARVVVLLALATQWPSVLPADPWAIWLLAVCYAPTVAMLWPIVQSYLSGGREGVELRRVVGLFNLTWGSALVVGFVALGPMLERSPQLALSLLGLLHLASVVLLIAFAPSPAAPPALGTHEPDPLDLELRRVLQGLLPLTNVLAFALAPFLPEAFARLGLPSATRASFAVAWLLPRAIAFAVLGRWHGWHGRRAAAWVGVLLLVVGFCFALLAPWIDTGALGLALEILGLCAFGVGMATVYTAAFYYAQAAGRAAVGAGSRHEALLGVGATVGPLLGLVVAGLVDFGALPPDAFEPSLVAGCVLCAFGITIRALRR